jgi:hypothetical protein
MMQWATRICKCIFAELFSSEEGCVWSNQCVILSNRIEALSCVHAIGSGDKRFHCQYDKSSLIHKQDLIRFLLQIDIFILFFIHISYVI